MPALRELQAAFARALLAYGQRRANEATERAARVADDYANKADNGFDRTLSVAARTVADDIRRNK